MRVQRAIKLCKWIKIRQETIIPATRVRRLRVILIFFTPLRASPLIQFDRIASAAHRVIAPRGSGIKGKANISPIGSCSGYPATPYLPRPDVRSRLYVVKTTKKIEPVCTPDRSSRSRRPLWPSPGRGDSVAAAATARQQRGGGRQRDGGVGSASSVVAAPRQSVGESVVAAAGARRQWPLSPSLPTTPPQPSLSPSPPPLSLLLST